MLVSNIAILPISEGSTPFGAWHVDLHLLSICKVLEFGYHEVGKDQAKQREASEDKEAASAAKAGVNDQWGDTHFYQDEQALGEKHGCQAHVCADFSSVELAYGAKCHLAEEKSKTHGT